MLTDKDQKTMMELFAYKKALSQALSTGKKPDWSTFAGKKS